MTTLEALCSIRSQPKHHQTSTTRSSNVTSSSLDLSVSSSIGFATYTPISQSASSFISASSKTQATSLSGLFSPVDGSTQCTQSVLVYSPSRTSRVNSTVTFPEDASGKGAKLQSAHLSQATVLTLGLPSKNSTPVLIHLRCFRSDI